MGDHDNMPRSAMNQVVAETLLRAKMVKSSSSQSMSNPGSIGHPDFCARPCLYYAAGASTCQNGNECGFCHMSHPKRPVRLDKRHREALKRLPFEELLLAVLPGLKEKAGHLDASGEISAMLDQLESKAHASSAARLVAAGSVSSVSGMQPAHARTSSGSGAVSNGSDDESRGGSAVSASSGSRRRENIHSVVHVVDKVLGPRSLLTMLTRMSPADCQEERLIIEQVFTRLHEVGTGSTEGSHPAMVCGKETTVSESSTQPSQRRVSTPQLAPSELQKELQRKFSDASSNSFRTDAISKSCWDSPGGSR